MVLTLRIVRFKGEVVAKCEHQEDVVYAHIGIWGFSTRVQTKNQVL